MKPLLSPEILRGAGGGGEGPRPRTEAAADDDLQHRAVRILWADGGRLDTALPTRGTALLQHGLKEWAAARSVAEAGGERALRRALHEAERADEMALVLCRQDGPWRETLRHLSADVPALCAALGAPPGLAVDLGLPLWLVGTDPRRSPFTRLDEMLRRLGAARLCAVLFLDQLALAGGTGRATPEAAAALLRWAQRLPSWPCVLLVSQALVLPAERGAMAELARHLGGALHRHRGLHREPFGPRRPA